MLMFYVYVLNNKRTNRLYVGYTENLKRRFNEHKEKEPDVELIYYEAYSFKKHAQSRERKLKLYGSAWRGLKKRLGL